jgi:serine O-acetyltransferase
MSTVDKVIVRLVYAQHKRGLGKLLTLMLQLLGVYFPRAVRVGPGLVLPHATTGLVIHYATRIGARVTIFHNVTVGRGDVLHPDAPVPGAVIEDDAVICAGAVILPGGSGPLTIGRGAVIGANAVVTKSVPAGETWVGNPARKIGGNEAAVVAA